MAVTKRISGNYTLSSTNAGGNDQFTITNFATITIDGNLVVLGNTINVDTVSVNLGDNVITLNTNLAQTAPPTLNAGVQINRGLSPNVWLLWNETIKNWQITNNGTIYGNIATNLNTISNVYGDPSPSLSANLNISGVTLYTNSTKGSVQLFANTASSGGSGIYVTNTLKNNAELITKAKAVAYSFVFG